MFIAKFEIQSYEIGRLTNDRTRAQEVGVPFRCSSDFSLVPAFTVIFVFKDWEVRGW